MKIVVLKITTTATIIINNNNELCFCYIYSSFIWCDRLCTWAKQMLFFL